MELAFQQGFASALLDVLFSRVTDVITRELKKFKNVNQAIDKLETTILAARNLLLEVDKSQFPSDIVHVWGNRVDKLTTLCYDAEDMMDGIALMVEKHNSVSSKKIERIRDALLHFPKIWTKPHGINKLQEKLDAILEELQVLASKMPNGYCNRNLEVPIMMVDDYVKQAALVGRDNDVESIIEKLISCKSNGVSIVGMGGLGKTALARTVMNDARIADNFCNRLWIDVMGHSFDKEYTIKKLRAMANAGAAGTSGNHKKNLIILDNLMAVTYDGWDSIWSYANDLGETKFLITTRDIRISKWTDTIPYKLRTLSQECCKALIIEKARLHNQKLSGQPFSQVACILASRCEGLPLIARIMGLVLAKCDEDKWSTLCNEEDIWKLKVFEKEIFPMLKTSYEGMQSDLRNCFAFFSLFPPNYHFCVDELVQLWVGAGLVHQPECSSSFGGMDHTHLNDLLGRSILQNCDEGMQRFELHKLSQKFALLTASKTCLRLDESMPSSSSLYNGTRHLSFFCENIQQPPVWSKIKALRCLCTILSLHSRNKIGRVGQISPTLFKTLGRLRVLALGNTDIDELPDSVKRLKLLRYLDVSSTPIRKLPETISELFGLQFLKFSKTPNLSRLPKDLHNLIKLVYLDWDSSSIGRLGLPSYIGNLSSLQCLPLFPVGEKEGHCVTELRNMKNLQDSIIINNLENIKNMEVAKAAMLREKLSLHKIVLQWNNSKNDSIAKDILEGLQPPDSLKELKITRYGGDVFPDWISNLSFLKKIHLQSCRSCTFLPALGQLPSLMILVLHDMKSLRNVDTSLRRASTSCMVELFPSLKILKLDDMPVLQEWRGLEANVMQHLCELEVINCPAMIHFPSLENLTSLSNLLIENCEALESFSGLPTSLKSLVIRESSKLKVECQVGGREWLKIGVVLDLEIDFKKIPTFDISVSSSGTSGVSSSQVRPKSLGEMGIEYSQAHESLSKLPTSLKSLAIQDDSKLQIGGKREREWAWESDMEMFRKRETSNFRK